jgi:hypothetical protein
MVVWSGPESCVPQPLFLAVRSRIRNEIMKKGIPKVSSAYTVNSGIFLLLHLPLVE